MAVLSTERQICGHVHLPCDCESVGNMPRSEKSFPVSAGALTLIAGVWDPAFPPPAWPHSVYVHIMPDF